MTSIVLSSSAVCSSSATAKGSKRQGVTMRSSWTGSGARCTLVMASEAEPLRFLRPDRRHEEFLREK